MREIKFRAWEPESKEMFRVVGVYFPNENSKSQDIIVNGRGGSANIKPEHLMQYTGLKDKNGKEIYEGDICRVEYKEPQEIKFTNGGFYFGSGTPMANFHLWSEKIEIIGNIYENPELLTNKE